jgi:hypothetical protein
VPVVASVLNRVIIYLTHHGSRCVKYLTPAGLPTLEFATIPSRLSIYIIDAKRVRSRRPLVALRNFPRRNIDGEARYTGRVS